MRNEEKRVTERRTKTEEEHNGDKVWWRERMRKKSRVGRVEKRIKMRIYLADDYVVRNTL